MLSMLVVLNEKEWWYYLIDPGFEALFLLTVSFIRPVVRHPLENWQNCKAFQSGALKSSLTDISLKLSWHFNNVWRIRQVLTMYSMFLLTVSLLDIPLEIGKIAKHANQGGTPSAIKSSLTDTSLQLALTFPRIIKLTRLVAGPIPKSLKTKHVKKTDNCKLYDANLSAPF